MSRVHAKRQADQCHLARIAKVEREQHLSKLAEKPQGQALLSLVLRLKATRLEAWSGVLRGERWLPRQSAEFRWIATRMLGDVHDRLMRERGLDPLEDPLPDAPESLWQHARRLVNICPAFFSSVKPDQPKRTKPMLTITINGPEDVAIVRETLAALAGLMAGSTPITLAPNVETEETPKRRTRQTKAVEAVPAQEASQPVSLLAEQGEPAAPTSDDVMKALQGYAKSAGPAALKALLTRFGVNRASELKAEDFARVLEATANG